MQTIEPTRGARLFGLAAAVLILFAFMLQAAPGAPAQGFKDDAPDDKEFPYKDAGIIDFRTYESPNWGWRVTWEEGWDLDAYYDPPVTTDEERQYDQLHLAWSGDDGASAYVTLQGAAATGDDLADELELLTDPAWIAQAWEPHFEVTPFLTYDDEDSVQVVYSIIDTSDNDARHYTIFETMIVNGDWVYVTFTTNAESLAAAFDATTGDLRLNRDPILTGIDWHEIEDAIEDAD